MGLGVCGVGVTYAGVRMWGEQTRRLMTAFGLALRSVLRSHLGEVESQECSEGVEGACVK